MSYRDGAHMTIEHRVWPRDMDDEDRTPQNAAVVHWLVRSLGPEWLPKSQRMVVRLMNQVGTEFSLTRHEMALNGVSA